MSEGNEVVFFAKATLHRFTGKTPLVMGEINLPLDRDVEEATGMVRVNPRSLKTGIRKRDRDMYHLLEVERFPEITYQLERLVIEVRNERGLPERVGLTGTVTVHGHSKPMELSGHIMYGEDLVTVEGEGKLDIRDFHLKPPRFLLSRVQPIIRVAFTVSLEVPLRLLLGKPEEK